MDTGPLFPIAGPGRIRRVRADCGQEYWLAIGLGGPSHGPLVPLDIVDHGDARRFLSRLLGDPFSVDSLRSIALDLDSGPCFADHDLLDHLAWAISSGDIRVLRREIPLGPAVLVRRKPAPPEPQQPEPIADKKLFVVRLEDEAGVALPEVKFEALLSTGEKRTGTLDRKGEALLADPPPGPVIVSYPDPEDVSAKALAAAARRGLDGPDHGPVFDLLQRDPATVKEAVASYDAHFNDLTGKGFAEDVGTVFTDPDARQVVDCLLARAGIATSEPLAYVEWRQQDGA